jgi:hypothetical protein
MDQPKDTKSTDTAATPVPPAMSKTPEIPVISASETPPIAAAKSELPIVESPSISPADLVKTGDADLEPASAPIPELAVDAPETAGKKVSTPIDSALYLNLPRIKLRPRHKRYALLAASVAIAAALGGVIGALATGNSTPPVNVAALEENKAMQQSVARLAKEVTTLKANLEEANKSTRAQVAKIDTKVESKIARLDERLKKEAEEVTGSISAPQTVAAVTPTAVPVPTPRPASRVASVESQPPARLQVVPGWSIRDARGGYIYVESRGDIYQIVPGAPLPGLGPVESIKRLDGRWVVTTPKGIIVSMRDRRYFE